MTFASGLDGVFTEDGEGALAFRALPHLRTEEVKDVLHTAARIVRHLARRGVLTGTRRSHDEDFAEREPALFRLAASAVSGRAPCGPEIRRNQHPIALRLSPAEITGPLAARASGPERARRASDSGRTTERSEGVMATLHAATRAVAEDERGREALLCSSTATAKASTLAAWIVLCVTHSAHPPPPPRTQR